MAQLEKIIQIIQSSSLDQTIKDIFIRDLQSEGLTEYTKEQLLAYCSIAEEELERQLAEAEQNSTTPTA